MSWIIDEGKFNENITLIDALMLGIPNNTGLYIIEGTERTALIDAASSEEAEKCSDKLMKMGIKPDILILTHSHWDHAAGTSIFQEKFPGLEIMVAKSGIEALKNPMKFNEVFIDFQYVPDLEPIEGVTTLSEGDKIDLGGQELVILETPGHTNCCISIFEQNHKVLFIGDIGNIWALTFMVPLIMPPEFSEENYIASIDRIRDLDCNTLALAHYGFLTGKIVDNFPDMVKATYFDWKDCFITAWNENPDKAFVIKKFVEKMNNIGIFDQPDTKFTLSLFGGWTFEGLRSGNLI